MPTRTHGNRHQLKIASYRIRNKPGWLTLVARYEVLIEDETLRKELCNLLASHAEDKRQFSANFDGDLLFVLWGRRLDTVSRSTRRRNGAKEQLLAHVTKIVEQAVKYMLDATEGV